MTATGQKPMSLDREADMKDIRCRLGLHSWVEKHVEGTRYYQCRRCHTDRTPGVAPVTW